MNQNPDSLKSPNIFLSPTNIIAIYTLLNVLLKMRRELGLEAMLQYMENYRRWLGAYNPKLQCAVLRALELIDVEKIYKEAMKGTDNIQ